MILLIDNYDSFTFNIVQYFRELKQKITVIKNDERLCYPLKNIVFKAVIISPGPGTPDNAGLSNNFIKIMSEKNIPILGICLGLQCIGSVFGCNIVHTQSIMHGKTSLVNHNKKDIFKDIPSPFNAVRYHSLCLDRNNFPDCLKITAISNDKTIMAIQHKNLPVYGVQYHPESILSEYGYKLFQNFLDLI